MTASTPAKFAAEIRNDAAPEPTSTSDRDDAANTHSTQEQDMHNPNGNPAAYEENVFLEGDNTENTAHGDALVHSDGEDIAFTIPDFVGEPGEQHRLVKADAVDFAHAILSAAGETVTIDGNHVDPLGRVWVDIDHDGRRFTEYVTYMGEVRPTPGEWFEVSTCRLYFDDGTVQRHIIVEANNPKLTAEQAQEAARHLAAAAAALDKTPEAGDA